MRHAAGQLACGLHPLGPSQVLLDPLPFGDVAIDTSYHGWLAVLEGAAQVAFDRDRGAGLGNEDQLHVIEPLSSEHPVDDLGVIRPAVGVDEIEQLHPADVVFAVSGALLPGLVDVQQGAVGRRHAHQVARVIEQVAVALLALPKCQVRPPPLTHVAGVEHDAADGGVGQEIAAHRLEPDRRAVRPPQGELDRAGHAGLPVGVEQISDWSSGRLDVRQQIGADQLAGRVPDDALGRVAGVEDGAVGRDDGDQVGRVLNQRAKSPFAGREGRFGVDLFGVRPVALERGLDGRTDPGQITLEQVVGGPGLHTSDGSLLVHRAGDDEERDARDPLSRQGECGHAVETREGVIGENQIGAEVVQLPEKAVPAIDSAGQERNAGALELVFHELGVHGHIFQDQDPERMQRHADPSRQERPPCRAAAHNPIIP